MQREMSVILINLDVQGDVPIYVASALLITSSKGLTTILMYKVRGRDLARDIHRALSTRPSGLFLF